MKNLLAIAISAAALSAMADATTAEGSNEIGTLAITSNMKQTVVAVPFTKLGASVDTIAPSDLVLNTNLVEGDQIYVFGYDANGKGSYKGWKLNGSGVWESVANASIDEYGTPTCSSADNNTVVSVGSGFWLVRKTEPSGSFTFYVYGQYVDRVVSNIAAGKQNLFANPLSVEARPVISETPENGDQILIPQTGTIPLRYTYKSGSWMHRAETVALPAFQAGQGAWYVSKGSSNLTCTWMPTAN